MCFHYCSTIVATTSLLELFGPACGGTAQLSSMIGRSFFVLLRRWGTPTARCHHSIVTLLPQWKLRTYKASHPLSVAQASNRRLCVAYFSIPQLEDGNPQLPPLPELCRLVLQTYTCVPVWIFLDPGHSGLQIDFAVREQHSLP